MRVCLVEIRGCMATVRHERWGRLIRRYTSNGVPMIEVHVTMARGTGLPDESSSVTVQEFAQMVEGVRFVERIGRRAYAGDREARLEPMRELFMGRAERVAK